MEYLRSCFAALVPVKEAPAPQYADLEDDCGEHGPVLVTDAADVRVQVAPLLVRTDIGKAMDV